MPSVGLAIIAKNEEKRLPTLLESIEGAFDQVVFVDTGSTDSTKAVFAQWALQEQKRNPDVDIVVGSFTWTKDFSAARTYAQSLLTTDWESWADCDDMLVGAQNIRAVIQQAPEQVAGYICKYNYAQHPNTGECVCQLKRERLVRRGKGKWINRVHEAQVVDGPVAHVDENVLVWVHRKQYSSVEEMEREYAGRNLEILDAWIKDEPDNTRVLAYLGTENMARGEFKKSIDYFNTYLSLNPDWEEEHVQVRRKLAACYLHEGLIDEAMRVALDGFLVHPAWPDAHLSLAEAHYAKGEWHKAARWAQEALRLGVPDTLLIINPLDYTYQPRKILAASCAMLKQWDEAVRLGQEALELNPADIDLRQMLMHWQTEAKKERTAIAVATTAKQLIAHDEQLKALKYLEECVPHFVDDHPGVVQLRSMLRERLQWIEHPDSLLDHYVNGGSKPEDFLSDEKSDEVANALPRVRFLYQGIHEQDVARRHQAVINSPEADAQLEAAIRTLSDEEKVSDMEDFLHNDRRIT